jgi:hypothetical protein
MICGDAMFFLIYCTIMRYVALWLRIHRGSSPTQGANFVEQYLALCYPDHGCTAVRHCLLH